MSFGGLLVKLAEEAGARFGGLGPFTPGEVAALVGHAFISSEALILPGLENSGVPARQALRKFGALIAKAEDAESRTRDAAPKV